MTIGAHWNPFHDLQLEQSKEKLLLCPYAVDFSTWRDQRCRTVLERPDYILLQLAMLDVTARYFDFLAVVPKAHRECVSDRGHRCIYHVFVETYKQLKAAELSINPPVLFVPAAPSAPVQPMVPIPGVVIGEIVGEA